MFRKIADRIQYPDWAKRWPRYTRLDQFDRLLDGTFYDHLPYAFYDEVDSQKKIIKLEERRPSAQFRIPRMVARWSGRKLFAGRHCPKLKLANDESKKVRALRTLLKRARFWQRMREVVLYGSVGSVAITFRVDGEGEDARLALFLWRAKYCKPSFDEFGELAQLRISYTTNGAALLALGMNKDCDNNDVSPTIEYWFIRDFTTTKEITYIPVPKDQWNPLEGFKVTDAGGKPKELKPYPDMEITHGLNFVPGHWFLNLPGGTGIDGDCTFYDAIPNSIEMDYNMSQLGRGTRYNAAPQLVIKGELINDSDDITRGPAFALQVRTGYKEEDGATYGDGDAKLLEMTGSGIKAGIELVQQLKKDALEIISASRKDPDKMHAPLSGRAMEYLDEESNDFVAELRSQYGDDGVIPLVRKIAIAAKALGTADVGRLRLQWPRLFQPTPDEILSLMQAFQIAVDPLKRATPPTPGQPAVPGGEGKPTKPAIPEQPAGEPEESEVFLTMEEARNFILLNLDLAMLQDDDDDDEADDVDESPTNPDEPTEPIPTPNSIDEDQSGTPEGDEDQGGDGSALATAARVSEVPHA